MFTLLLVASAFSESIVDLVNNNPQSTWTAKEYPREIITLAKMRARSGTKLSHYHLGKYTTSRTFDESFDARTKWGNKILAVRNQYQCGSCWAFAVVEHFADRLEIAGTSCGDLSPQDLVSCDTDDLACDGGEFETSMNWTVNHGVTTEKCLEYVSWSGNIPTCPSKCDDGSAIYRYKASSWKHLTVEEAMEEIQTNGPVAASFMVYIDFMYYAWGIYQHYNPTEVDTHGIIVLGWGVEDGVKYWLCQNSWGADWGEKGCFRILRGTNECQLEDNFFTLYV